MNSDNNFLKEFFEKEAEERQIRAAETEMRYAGRREEKAGYRRRIENAAAKVCEMIETEAQKPASERKIEEIVALAAALNHITVAMHAAENYAESRPYYSTGFGLGCSG